MTRVNALSANTRDIHLDRGRPRSCEVHQFLEQAERVVPGGHESSLTHSSRSLHYGLFCRTKTGVPGPVGSSYDLVVSV